MKKLASFGPLFIIIAAVLWSFDGVLRRGLYTLPPAVVVFYEHLLGAIVLLFLIGTWKSDLPKMTRKEWVAITVVALFSGALGTILYTAALGQVQYIQYSVVVLLQQLQPIWAISAAAILLHEKVSRKFLLWAGVAMVAAYLISFKDLTVNLDTGAGTAVAAAFALLAGMMWGASTAGSKLVLKRVHFLTGTALRFLIAPVFALMFVVGGGATDQLFTLTGDQWSSLLMITFSTGLVALVIYYYGLKKVPARISTLCELAWPASAVIIDYVYFKQGLTVTQIAGVVLLGLALYHVTGVKRNLLNTEAAALNQ